MALGKQIKKITISDFVISSFPFYLQLVYITKNIKITKKEIP